MQKNPKGTRGCSFGFENRQRKPKVQSRMDNLETLVKLGKQDTGRRQTKQQQQQQQQQQNQNKNKKPRKRKK